MLYIILHPMFWILCSLSVLKIGRAFKKWVAVVNLGEYKSLNGGLNIQIWPYTLIFPRMLNAWLVMTLMWCPFFISLSMKKPGCLINSVSCMSVLHTQIKMWSVLLSCCLFLVTINSLLELFNLKKVGVHPSFDASKTIFFYHWDTFLLWDPWGLLGWKTCRSAGHPHTFESWFHVIGTGPLGGKVQGKKKGTKDPTLGGLLRSMTPHQRSPCHCQCPQLWHIASCSADKTWTIPLQSHLKSTYDQVFAVSFNIQLCQMLEKDPVGQDKPPAYYKWNSLCQSWSSKVLFLSWGIPYMPIDDLPLSCFCLCIWPVGRQLLSQEILR